MVRWVQETAYRDRMMRKWVQDRCHRSEMLGHGPLMRVTWPGSRSVRSSQIPNRRLSYERLAEGVGFEPAMNCPKHTPGSSASPSCHPEPAKTTRESELWLLRVPCVHSRRLRGA